MPRLVPLPEAAIRLGVPYRRCYDRLADLGAVRGPGRHWLIPEKSLIRIERMIAAGLTKPEGGSGDSKL